MIWIYVLFALLFLCFAVGAITFFATCIRRKQVDILDENAVKGTRYESRHPGFVNTHRRLSEAGIRDVFIQSHDGLQLYAGWIPAENAQATVIIVHGYHSHAYIDFGQAIAYYRQRGMNLLLIDQRSHGKSQGKYITMGIKEYRDVLCWIDYHNAHLAQCPVFLHGLSMGAATVMFTADKQLPANVRGIIADCGFTSPKAIFGHLFSRDYHLPAWPFLWATDLCARLFAGFGISQMDSRKTMKNPVVPALLLHGTADRLVPSNMSEQIFEVCQGEKSLLLIEGATHAKCFPMAPERCMDAVGAFIDKNLEVTGELRNYQKL